MYKPSLPDSEYKFISHDYFETNTFYGRPKIHKPEILHKAKDFKLRPIVAGSKCPTRRLSNFLDPILKPLTKHVKSNIKDNVEFLKYVSEMSQMARSWLLLMCAVYTLIFHVNSE